MAYRKRTLRQMPAFTRRYAKLISELESSVRRAKTLVPLIQRMELDSLALQASMPKVDRKATKGERK